MGDVCRMCMCVCGVLVSPNSGDKADQRFWGLKASLMILLCPRVCVYVMIDKDSHMCLQGVFWSAPCVQWMQFNASLCTQVFVYTYMYCLYQI